MSSSKGTRAGRTTRPGVPTLPLAVLVGLALGYWLGQSDQGTTEAWSEHTDSATPRARIDADAGKTPSGSNATTVRTPVTGTVVESEAPVVDAPHVDPASDDISVPLEQLERQDANRLLRINAALTQGGRPAIWSGAKIARRDLDTLRQIVDEAERDVNEASDGFLSASCSATRELEKDLFDRIDRHETQGLPLMSPQNPFSRTHPYEALSQVFYEGHYYVLRVGPWQDPALARAGGNLDAAKGRRLASYVAMIAPMFR